MRRLALLLIISMLSTSFSAPVMAEGTENKTYTAVTETVKDTKDSTEQTDAGQTNNEKADGESSDEKTDKAVDEKSDEAEEEKADEPKFADSKRLIEGLLGTETEDAEDGNMTRERFVSVICSLMKVPFSNTEKQIFSDVDAESEYAESIATAVSLDWISAQDKFRPTENITMLEAETICVNAIGLKGLAVNMGGFPGGYTSVASRMGLTKNTSGSINGAAEADRIYRLLENFMTADLGTIRTDLSALGAYGGGTLLEKLYDIYKVEGVVSATSYNSLISQEYAAGEGNIEIRGKRFNCSIADETWLGYDVKAYFDDTDDTIVSISKTYRNSEDSYFRKDMKYENGNLSRFKEENHSYSRVSLNKSFDLLYNGKKITEEKISYLTGTSGKMRFLDNNDDGKYDIVFVEDYTYVTVQGISLGDKPCITDMKNSDSQIDLSKAENDFRRVITEDGTKLLKDVEQGDILQVAISNDKKYVRIYDCTEKISGYLKAYDETHSEATVDDTDYNVSEYFKKLYTKAALLSGKEYTFNIGLDGNLISVSYSDESYYGFVIKMKVNEDDDTILLRILGEDGEIFRSVSGKKIRIDGEMVKNDRAAVFDKLGVYDVSEFKRQLIKYRINSVGELTEIDTESKVMPKRLGDMQSRNNNLTNFDGKLQTKDGKYKYRENSKAFVPGFGAGGAIVFWIPQDKYADDTSKYYVTDVSAFANDKTYSVIPYDIGIDGAAKAIVYKEDVESIAMPFNNTNMSIVVEKVNQTLNNDDLCYQISGWSNGEFKNILVEPEIFEAVTKTSGTPVSTGDIIRTYSIGGVVRRIVVDFDGATVKPIDNERFGISDITYTASGQYDYGKVYSFANGTMYLSNTINATTGEYDFSFDKLRYNVCATDKIIVVDTKINKIIQGTQADVLSYVGSGSNASYVVLIQSYKVTDAIVIYI